MQGAPHCLGRLEIKVMEVDDEVFLDVSGQLTTLAKKGDEKIIELLWKIIQRAWNHLDEAIAKEPS